MKSVVHFGPNFSGLAYKGTLPGSPIIFVAHEFKATADGQLQHLMDGRLVATVPPAGQGDYARTWPQCIPVLTDLRAAERSARLTIKPGKVSGSPKKARKGARRR
jgi:hypothetical protein